MHRITGWVLAALLLVFAPAWAQSPSVFAGQWQGTVNAGAQMRLVVVLAQGEGGALTGRFHAIEPPVPSVALTELMQTGGTVKFNTFRNQGMKLTLSPDGQSLVGNMLAGGFAVPVTLVRATPATAWPLPVAGDTTAHKTHMVKVSDGVEVEVVDWGGSGRPLVFLSGLGQTAHAFDAFALRFTGQYRVIGLTRRGFGASGKPDAKVPTNYTTERLGDDVLAVMDALKLVRQVQAGWSIAGGELSSVASRHPQKVSGLIYLDAASHWAFYTPGLKTSFLISIPDLQQKLGRFVSDTFAAGNEAMIDSVIASDLPGLVTDLRRLKAYIQETRKYTTTPPPAAAGPGTPGAAIMASGQKFAAVRVPVLAIFAIAEMGKDTPANIRPVVEMGIRQMQDATNAYAKGNPQAKVVRIAGGRHDIFASHPDLVAKEMNAFLAAQLHQ